MKLTIKTTTGELIGSLETPAFPHRNNDAKLPRAVGHRLANMIGTRQPVETSFTIETASERLEGCHITTSGGDPMKLAYLKATPL